MFAEERQQALADLVTRRGRVSVAELSKQFTVTTETVRRDLRTLEELGLVRRVHGGAIPVGSVTLAEPRLTDRDVINVVQKRAIARAALRFLPSAGATVLLDAGSTTRQLVESLPADRPLTVATHAVPLAAMLAMLPQVELHLLPGRVRAETQAAVGVDTVASLSRLRADVAFMGTNGMSVGHGLSTPDVAEAATKAAMIAAAHLAVVLCDSSKLGLERTVRFAALSDIDVLVTDGQIPDETRADFERAGVEVVIA